MTVDFPTVQDLKRAVSESGLSQQEIARRLGVSVPTVTEWLSDNKPRYQHPSLRQWATIQAMAIGGEELHCIDVVTGADYPMKRRFVDDETIGQVTPHILRGHGKYHGMNWATTIDIGMATSFLGVSRLDNDRMAPIVSLTCWEQPHAESAWLAAVSWACMRGIIDGKHAPVCPARVPWMITMVDPGYLTDGSVNPAVVSWIISSLGHVDRTLAWAIISVARPRKWI
jgi:hypothetical protein